MTICKSCHEVTMARMWTRCSRQRGVENTLRLNAVFQLPFGVMKQFEANY